MHSAFYRGVHVSMMPVCAVCENESFNEVNGLYYCYICGTQSQDIRDEETADMVQDHNPRLMVQEKKGQSRRKDRNYEDKGQPWVMCEAYQFVIKAQVEALIKLGVNPKLKDIVGQIWFKYLQHFGIAFQNAPEGTGVSVNVPSSARDAYIFGKPWKTDRRQEVIQESDEDQLELCSQLSKEEFYDEDNPCIEREDKDVRECPEINPTNDSENKADDSTDSETEFVGSIGVPGILRSTKRHKLGMSTTLAFAYLGLLWLKEPVFLSDLLRWTREGHIPLFRVTDILPGYMKLKETDSMHLYLLHQVNREWIRRAAGHVAQAIRLPKFPELCMSVFTSRFIVDLQLPALLHGCVWRLLKVFHPRTRFNIRGKRQEWTVPCNEENAMAYIMVAMKLCYGLNDTDERDQANLAEETRDPSENSLPVFEDWLGGFKKCFSERARNGVPWSKEELNLLQEPSNYGTFCKTDIFGKWVQPDLAATEERSPHFRLSPLCRALRLENREKRSELFRSLVSGGNHSNLDAEQKSSPTSFPTTCRHTASGADKEGEQPQANCSQKCFTATKLRRIPFESLHPQRENSVQGSRYFLYLKDEDGLRSVHHSYNSVLQVLASRIETTPELLHKRVKSLESILFSEFYLEHNDRREYSKFNRLKMWL